jgi:uncharacterized protein (DUF2141 family)
MRTLRAVISVVVLATTATAAISIAARADEAPVIRAALSGFRNDAGQAGCVIYSSADGFPTKPEKAVRNMFVPIAGKTATCEFAGLPPGTYAIAAFHDENKNGKMDKNFVGAPAEGTGTSRDAKPAFMGPPSFKDAAFAYPGGVVTMPIPMHY